MKLQENTVFANRYELAKLLGRGGFSEVWLAKDQWTHLNVAIKVYAPGQGMEEDGMREFCGELATVFDLGHPNLLEPKHVDSWEGMPYLIMAYCPNGSCERLIGKVTEEQMWKMIHDVASGLAYLHEKGLVHQDIKPANVMIDEDGHYLITDFGVSSRARSTLRKSVVSSTGGGTTAYMGPERFSKQPAPTKASDIWSFGAMCFEMLEGEVPFGEIGGGMQKGGADIPMLSANVSNVLKFVITKMLQKETRDRPTAVTLVEWSANPAGIDVDKSIIFSEEEHLENIDTGRITLRYNDIPLSELKTRAISKPVSDTQKNVLVNQSQGNALLLTINGVTSCMRFVRGGIFQMGATKGFNDEKPVHCVTLSDDYYIGETEVTQALWQAVMGSNPSYFKGDNLPVEGVSWNDCQEFISKLNKMTGRRFALPTEAQWEFAARGGNKSQGYKYSGSNSIDDVAWYGDNSFDKTHPVGEKQANELGLYDMSGNVWEWCADRYGDYSLSSQIDPIGVSSGTLCVLRGGSWGSNANYCRSAIRSCRSLDHRDYNCGFRLVLLF